MIKLSYWAWVTCGLICQTIVTEMQAEVVVMLVASVTSRFD